MHAAIALLVLILTYFGMAAGRIAWLRVDRTGIALLAVIALLASNQMTLDDFGSAVDVPTLALLFSKANAASGGVSSVTVPVQLSPMTAGSWTDFGGSFPAPQVMSGLVPAEFNLKGLVVPVPLLGMQSMLQVDETVVSLLEATMDDASNQAVSMLTSALFNNSTNAQQLGGLPLAIANTGTYGGISRSTDTNWQANVIAEGSVAPSRNSPRLDFIKTTTSGLGRLEPAASAA